jgi:hypothetical protein
VARALVYATIGVLAGQVAIGEGGRTTDTHGAIEALGRGMFGEILLVLVAVGLTGYAVWRFIQGIADTDGKGSDMKGIAVRAGYVGSGLINLGLAYAAVRMLIGARGSGGNAAREWSARLLQAPMGPTLLIVAGAIVVGVGLYQFYKAFSEKFRKKLETGGMNPEARRWAIRISKIGLSTRGIVYMLIGMFLMRAATEANPGRAEDVGGAMRQVGAQSHGGAILLGMIALGFIAYAGYALVNAFYRRINASG